MYCNIAYYSSTERTFELGDNFGPIVVKVSHAEGQPGVDIGIGCETNEGYAECHRFVSGREDSFKIWQRQSASGMCTCTLSP